MPTRTLTCESVDEWRNAVSTSFVPLRAEAAPGTFRGRIQTAENGGVHFSAIEADPHRALRTATLARGTDGPFFKVSLQLTGSQLLTQDDHRVVLRPGDLAIYDSTRPYSLESSAPFSSLVLMFPHENLQVPASDIATVVGTNLACDDGVGPLVCRMLGQIASDLDALMTPGGGRLTHSVLDMVATALTERLAVQLGHTDHEHRTLALRVRAFIEAHLAEPTLGPEPIAAAHYVSTRHLQKVFKAEGHTVTGWIRGRRLQRCREELVDPLHAGRSVSAVGARWGFPDAAHFSRVFKAAFGMTPSEWRVQGCDVRAAATGRVPIR
jgi:AraC-like DNA-binding protein